MLASCSDVEVSVKKKITDNKTEASVNLEIDKNVAPEEPEVPEDKVEENKFTCEDWAQTLIPEFVTVYEGEPICDREVFGTFRDGTVIKLEARGIEFVKNINKRLQIVAGSEKGEDVSKYYIKAFNGDLVNLHYVKSMKRGNEILGDNEFEIKVLSYERMESSKEQADSTDCVTYEYKLGNYEFVSCTRVA